MTTKFTEGPWNVFIPTSCANYRPGIDNHQGQTIVLFGNADDEALGIRGPSQEEMMANAHLISAAPDLLEALEIAECGIVELCNEQNPANECWNTLRIVRDAIAKAIGEK